MTLLILLLYILIYYIVSGVAIYLFAVLKSWEYTRVWNWTIRDGFVGVIPYPKSMLWWLELLVNRLGGKKNVE